MPGYGGSVFRAGAMVNSGEVGGYASNLAHSPEGPLALHCRSSLNTIEGDWRPMTRMMGGILGSLLMLVPAALMLVTSQGQSCSDDWWTCTPGSDAARTIQMIGVALLIVGPYFGYRIGARLAPSLDRNTAIGVVLGAIPGIVTLAFGVWIPYAASLMLVGAIVGGIVATRVSRSRSREPQPQ